MNIQISRAAVCLLLGLCFECSLAFMTNTLLAPRAHPCTSRSLLPGNGFHVLHGPRPVVASPGQTVRKFGVARPESKFSRTVCLKEGIEGKGTQMGDGYCVHFINLSNGEDHLLHCVCTTMRSDENISRQTFSTTSCLFLGEGVSKYMCISVVH